MILSNLLDEGVESYQLLKQWFYLTSANALQSKIISCQTAGSSLEELALILNTEDVTSLLAGGFSVQPLY